ncbi:MAG: hypothetical protein U9R75_02170 [Candidatus Thermoplasmatota archaeon]|nr:hypothetical protein [Candidatus Thermoplasmatota archaeon]
MSEKGKGEGLARTGAVLVWSSFAVLLFSIAVFMSFFLVQVSEGIGEEDFREIEPGVWEAEMYVDTYGSISCRISSTCEEVELDLTIEDEDGWEIETGEYTTPVTKEIVSEGSGTYIFTITILNNGSFSDLQISIYSYSMGAVFLCCGVSMLGIVFLGLLITGFVLLMVALYKRNRKEVPTSSLPPSLPHDYYAPRPYQQSLNHYRTPYRDSNPVYPPKGYYDSQGSEYRPRQYENDPPYRYVGGDDR